ncbi:fimbrillin family protein [Prevotella sp.]|uniref:fimbrillin family protein n=1 Tax=Prevotella sp. TaxID=59823 RepID=UPI0025F86536|nr:fimbrillin family protein [Prevotella sp.]MCI6128993.1 fimbrillin family protein [Prevotella sp.]
MKIHQLTASIAAVLLSASLFSCSSDDFFGKAETNTDGISFGVSTENGASTRANNSADGYTAARYTLRSDNSADTLCVRAVVTDGIGNSNAGRPATRAAMQTSMYDKFNVVAAVKENGTVGTQYYMDDVATNKTGTNWVPSKVYYWPGSNRQLRFLAWAPTDATFQSVPNNPNATTLQYTTPAEANNQRDIVAAATGFISNPSHDATCTPVDLQFKHLCTAVIIKTGEQMTAGTIKSVSLKGVKNSGTYNMEDSTWKLTDSKADFTISPNQVTTSTTTDGTDLNAGESTFMLLPQTLGTDSKLEVAFHDNISGNDRILSASLKDAVWPMGKTVTYRLSITPEYELKFTSEPEVQDAHYVIYPIKIKVDNNLRGGWQLTSNDPANVTFVQTFQADAIKNLVDKGYWFKDHCGTSTLTSSAKGEVKVYVFIKENISNSDRDITLSLTPVDYPSAKPETFTFKQYCPAWNNGIGVERKQEIDYPWGFNWDSNMKITYKMPSNVLNALRHILFLIFGDKSYVEDQGLVILDNWEVIVDFSKVPPLKTATNTTDGLKNTWEICNFEGISEAEGIMNQLESWGGKPDKTLPTNPSEFAAMACAKKNAYSLKIEQRTDKITGKVEYSYIPTLAKEDMVWYLPAQDEAPNMKDDLFNLSGDYWTSTAITDPGTTSYKYTAGGAVSPENRNAVIHVRAVRKKKAERL